MNKPDFFVIETVTISSANQLKEFEVKLPGNAKRIIGYKVTANKINATAIAQVSISFNGARENTINCDVIVHTPATMGRRSLPLKQNLKLLNNSYAKGFVEDLGVQAPSYKVKIYFHLSTQ